MDLPVYLDYIGAEPEKPSLDFDYLYASAAGVGFNGDRNFGDFLTDITELRSGADNIYIFAREVTEAVTDCAERLCLSGRNAVIFYYTKNTKNSKNDGNIGECKIWRKTTAG
jgi:hypothetical protein